MAQVASTEALLEQMGRTTNTHVWIDEENQLVTGPYPNATAWFDFGNEKLVPFELSASEPQLRQKKFVSLLHQAGRKTQEIDIETHSAIYRVGSYTQLMIVGMDLIEELVPGAHQKLAHDPKMKGRAKRPIAASHRQLYDDPHKDEKFSTKLKSGYFVATNNKSDESWEYVKRASTAVGLKWGKDFSIRKVNQKAAA